MAKAPVKGGKGKGASSSTTEKTLQKPVEAGTTEGLSISLIQKPVEAEAVQVGTGDGKGESPSETENLLLDFADKKKTLVSFLR